MTGRRYHAFTSPLRYPGGKGILAKFIRLLLANNKLLDREYVEPYAGGASVAWELLFTESVRRVHVNDIDQSVMSFWRSVTDHTDELCRMIRDTDVDFGQW